MNRLIIITIMFLTCVTMYSQVTVVPDSIFQYRFLTKLYSFRHIAVKNQTDQLAICWLAKDTIQKNEDQFCHYFMMPKGDFSLYGIITEYGSTLEIENVKQFPKLYETFYKVIEPFSTFDIYFLTDDLMKKVECNNMVQTVLLNEVEKYFNKTMIKPLYRLSYTPNDIVIFIEE